MEKATYIKKVLNEFRESSLSRMLLVPSKKKKNPLLNQETFKVKYQNISFPITITDEQPFFRCGFCQTAFCKHIAYLLYEYAKIKNTDLLALYYYWTPEFIQEIIKKLRGKEVFTWDQVCRQMYEDVLKSFECPVCQEDLHESPRLHLFQCDKCFKPMHQKCWNTWVKHHKKSEQVKLRCLHCHA